MMSCNDNKFSYGHYRDAECTDLVEEWYNIKDGECTNIPHSMAYIKCDINWKIDEQKIMKYWNDNDKYWLN